MNKKLLLLIIILVIGGITFIVISKTNKVNNENLVGENNPISEEEKESGQAETISDETDSWNIYEDDSGFSIQYPQDISFGKKDSKQYGLTIESNEISSLEGTLGFNKETAEKNLESLKNGQYGETVDMPLENSKKITKIGTLNAQDFVVLSRFEVCSVTFERSVYFFNNGYQVVITLSAPKEEMISKFPQYFKTDKENCGSENVWIFEKQKEFYSLANKGELGIASDWLKTFDSIIKTIKFTSPVPEEGNKLDYSLIAGKWESLEDPDSSIEFKEGKKIDYYKGEKMSEDAYTLKDGVITVNSDGEEMKYEIVGVSSGKLTLSYLARGNTLNYKKSK